MQKCGTTKGVLYKGLSKTLCSSNTLPVFTFIDENGCIHINLHIVLHIIGKQIVIPWKVQQGGSIFGSMEV